MAESVEYSEGELIVGSSGLRIGGANLAQDGTYGKIAGGNQFESSQRIHQGYLFLDWDDATDASAPEIHYGGYNGAWVSGIDVANSPKSRDFVPIAKNNIYYVNDLVLTLGSPTATSAAEGNFSSKVNTATVEGPGVPAGTTLTFVDVNTVTMSNNATASGTIRAKITMSGGGVTDGLYVRHRGGSSMAFGLGSTPPSGAYRVQAAGSTTEAAMGSLSASAATGQTGHYFACVDSGATARLWIEQTSSGGNPLINGNHATYGSGVAVQRLILANTATSSSPLVVKAPNGQQADIALYQLNGTTRYSVDSAGRPKFGLVVSPPALSALADGQATLGIDASGNLVVTSRVGGVLKTGTVTVA